MRKIILLLLCGAALAGLIANRDRSSTDQAAVSASAPISSYDPEIASPADRTVSAHPVTPEPARPQEVRAEHGFTQDPPLREGVIRSRFITVNLERLGQTTQTTLPLFADAVFPMQVTRRVMAEPALSATVWKLEGTGETASLAPHGAFAELKGASVGYIWDPERARTFRLQRVTGDQYRVEEMDPAAAAPCGIALGEEGLSDPEPTTSSFLADTSRSIIDVLVVYTTAAREEIGGAAAMEAEIAIAVFETNRAFENSDVSHRIRLVGVDEVNYAETNQLQTDLNRLRNKTDGYMDAVHGLRDDVGADVVSLWRRREGADWGGIANFANRAQDADKAFGVVVTEWAVSNFTFAHELGHNFGCDHDDAYRSPDAPFSYGRGIVYTRPVNNHPSLFGTIMAYSTYNIPFFSDPFLTDPDGQSIGASSLTDNARVLRNTAANLAAFRSTRIPHTNSFQANAGADQYPWAATRYENQYWAGQIYLDATQSTGFIGRVEWWEGAVQVGDSFRLQLTLVPPGRYEYEMRIYHETVPTLMDTDTVVVTVHPVPIAKAGPDQVVVNRNAISKDSAVPIVLNGTGSTYTGGTITKYQWLIIDDPDRPALLGEGAILRTRVRPGKHQIKLVLEVSGPYVHLAPPLPPIATDTVVIDAANIVKSRSDGKPR